jgi:N6-L-threonylcarbamoyladenine synthase
MKILGIETSCDETAAAVIQTIDKNHAVKLLSNSVATSLSLHAQTGGIIPEIAAREQIKYILPVINDALKKSQISEQNIDAIAVTVGPGLIGSLLVGVETAKTLSMIWNKPIIPVNHLFGHMYANWIETDEKKELPQFPVLSLIVSGGHTDLVLIHDHKHITWIAGTRDDAAGEAFDKIGRLLGLPYPAGPTIELLAKEGNPKRFHFPRPLLHEPTYDFSFSGLKTAVLREVERHSELRPFEERSPFVEISESPNDQTKEQLITDLARATQDAIIDVLVTKTLKAAQEYYAKSIILSGGVAANQTLREKFEHELHTTYQIRNTKLFVPQKNLCTDNGGMIATAGFYNYEEKNWNEISANPELYFD